MDKTNWDVIVVGAGNAAFCAALSARDQSARVLMLERAPEHQRGGNTFFTDGGFRIIHNGTETVKKVVPDLSEEEIANSDFGSYTREQYLDDLANITQYRIDPDLAETLADCSTDTVYWMRDKGVRFAVKFGRQAYEHEGKFKFIAGLVIRAAGGGQELIEGWVKSAVKHGVEIRYNNHAKALLRGRSGIEGVRAIVDGVEENFYARSVVLACGGFEANREWRLKYLGPGWDLVKVRGSRYNTGDGIQMALDIGAQAYGHWGGCHAVSWDRYSTEFGENDATTSAQRNCFQFGIMINNEGKRFLDEGADFREHTYAKYGRVVLQQPGGYAWQVFCSREFQYLRPEYKKGASVVRGNTLEELAERMETVDRVEFVKTVREYNAAIKREIPFNPNVKDGRCTAGLAINKSNWAMPLEEPPYEAYEVSTGITFTFGGVRIDKEARVLDMNNTPLPGLYAAGEMAGGVFYFNYMGAAGLMAGAVFGRIAGRGAGQYARTSANA